MVLLDICFVPAVFGLVVCCFGGVGNVIKGVTSCKVCPYDDRRSNQLEY